MEMKSNDLTVLTKYESKVSETKEHISQLFPRRSTEIVNPGLHA